MANTAINIADIMSSPEYAGNMNEQVREQIEKALAESKVVSDPKTKSSSRRTPSLGDVYRSPEHKGEMNEQVRAQIEKALAETKIVPKKPRRKPAKKLPKPQTEQNIEKQFGFKDIAKGAVKGTLGLGSSMFNRMFPTLGTFMSVIHERLNRQERGSSEVNTSTQEQSQQVSRSSVFLNNIAESQARSNMLLQQILEVVNTGQALAPQTGSGNINIPTPNIPGRRGSSAAPAAAQGAARTGPSLARRIVTGGLVAGGLAVAGAAAYAATRPTEPTPDAGRIPTPNPQQTTAPRPTEPTPNPQQTPDTAVPPPEPATELTARQRLMADRYLRSIHKENDPSARELTESIVRRIRPSASLEIDEAVLENNYQSIMMSRSNIGMTIAAEPVIPGTPLTEAQMTAIDGGIMMNGRNHYPPQVLEMYDRQKAPAATLSAPAATPSAREPAVSALPAPREMTAQATRQSGSPMTQQEQADLFNNRILNVRAKEIVFKADRFEFDQTGGSTMPMGSAGGAGSATMTTPPPTAAMTTPPPPAAMTTPPPPAGGATEGGPLMRPTAGQVTSGFGQRSMGNHQGIDFGIPVGSPIVSSQSGTVVEARTSSSYGNMVRIRGNDGIETLYAHLSSVGVQQGQQVERGQQIALSGNTGRSTGPHLHFETIRDGQRVDPAPLIGAAGEAPRPLNESGTQDAQSSAPPNATMAQASPTTGQQVAQASVQSEVSVMNSQQAPASGDSSAQPSTQQTPREPGTLPIDPNNPGPVEPADAAQRYASLFNMAA